MKCVACKSENLKAGLTTVTLERDDTVVVVRSVPARVCANCGEAFVDEETASKVLALADRASESGSEVEILQFAA